MQTMMRNVSRSWLLLLLLAWPRGAVADVRVVSEVTVEAGGATARRAVTMCWRDDKVRVEVEGGAVLIYDLGGRKVYRLDAARKTYRVADLGEAAPTDAAARLRASKRRVRVDVKAAQQSRTVAGLTGRKCVVAAHVEEEPSALRRENPWGAASIRAGGYGLGIPTGAPPRPGKGTPPREPEVIDVTAEYWVSDAVPMGRSPLAALPYLDVTLPDGASATALLEPLCARLAASAQGFPVSSRVVATPVGTPAAGRTVIGTEVRSVTSGPLDRLLFYVPSDYTMDEGGR